MCITKQEIGEVVDQRLKERDLVRDNDFDKKLDKSNQERDKNLSLQLSNLKHEIFEKVDGSINSRLKHSTASPETKTEISKINSLCSQRGTDFALMRKDLQETKKDVKEIKETLTLLVDKMDSKYAPKIAWDIMKFIGGAVGLALIGALMTLLLK